MTTHTDKTYRREKLLDWEVKSLTNKYEYFSFSRKSTWLTLGMIILGLSVFGLIIPFIPPRYSRGNWVPATTIEEYISRLASWIFIVPVLILSVFAFVNIRNKIDLRLRVKWTANFKVTEIYNLGATKILLLNGWRPFGITRRERYFNSANEGQIITIKRTATFGLIDYYIRDEKTYGDEQKKKGSH